MSDLNLTHRGLTELPLDTLTIYKHITHLYLASNLLRRIEDRKPFSILSNLQYLDLSNNSLIFINLKLFKQNPSLRILILNNNPHLLVSPSTVDLPSLEELHLEDCGLETLRTSIFQDLTGLKKLNLQWNQFKVVPDGLSRINVIMLKGNPILIDGAIKDNVFNWEKDYYFGWAAELDDLTVVQIGFFIIAAFWYILYYFWRS